MHQRGKSLQTKSYVGKVQCTVQCNTQCTYLCAQPLHRVLLFATLRTVARQAPLSTGFPRQEYWSGLLRPPPVDLPNSGVEAASDMNVNRMNKLHRNKNQTTPREGTRIIE